MRTLRGLWPRLPVVALSLSLSVGLTLWGGAMGGPAGAGGGGGGGGPGSTRTSHAANSHSHSHVSSHASSHTSPPRRPTRAPNDDAALFCTDTCAAGLGAPRCGDAASCRPARLRNASAAHLADAMAVAESEPKHGQPREELCPQLCPLLLGEPLCSCGGTTLAAARAAASTTWRQEACDVLCAATGRVPRGCDPCQPTVAYTAAETIDWEWWCHVLCLEGDGGIACLCDLNP